MTRPPCYAGVAAFGNNVAMKMRTFLRVSDAVSSTEDVKRETLSRYICSWRPAESCGLEWYFSSVVPAPTPGSKLIDKRGRGGTNVTCPAKTSKVSAKAALSSRLLGVSLWFSPTLSRRCQCCSQRRQSGRSERLCPSVDPSDPQEPPLLPANSWCLYIRRMNLLNKNTRFGFISRYRDALPLFRLPTGDVSASLGRNVAAGPIPESRKNRVRPHSDCFFRVAETDLTHKSPTCLSKSCRNMAKYIQQPGWTISAGG